MRLRPLADAQGAPVPERATALAQHLATEDGIRNAVAAIEEVCL